ncbi:protein SRC2-like [Neltuma alba]|uniref:protein SRC2-like n=1 Tax=Neltuma alba TaxID=207710 RepID=UPI0010A4E852|nr:protein SRC2-like [Prosopis alba]XP_028776589.1 protein SRC2-like [Prosopis alba]
MDYRTLELNIVSAKDIKKVSHLSKMHVYAVASIIDDPQQNQLAKTPIHRHAGDSPTWNFAVQFTFNESLAKQNRLTLYIRLFSHRSIFGDKEIGSVRVPVNELIDRAGDGNSLQHMNYDVRKPSGKSKGVLNISYKFGEKFTGPPPTVPKEAPAMAYPPPPPPMGSSSMPYPPPPPQHGAPYGYPPPPPYGGYPPTQPGYGYPAQPGYGYPPVHAPAKKSKFGMGMGAGLMGGALGGLLIGDMISDASAYDASFDDGAGFDF